MTLALKLYLDMVTNLHTKFWVNRSNGSKVIVENSTLFDVIDLDLDPMTLISKCDPDMMVTYLHIKKQSDRSKGSKVMA